MFKLPKDLINMIDKYRDALNEYLEGKISPNRFKGIRVPFGFYSQRASAQLMGRVRIPAGGVISSQLKALANLAGRFNLRIHITDRQDIQLHGISYEDSIKILEYLKDYDLSTIGGGGNTVRNISACYLSGLCKNEIFDIRRYAVGITEYLLKDPISAGKLPRKFKIAFSGCSTDCAYALVNDVGLIATERESAEGFKVYCGGGMGAFSAIGQVLEDFITADRVPYVIKAVMLTYNKHGDRLNRHRNRLRFLIQDIGFARFRELYERELNMLQESEYAALREVERKELMPLEQMNLNERSLTDKNFGDFLKNCVSPQKHPGYYLIELHIPQGDITDRSLEEIASLEEIVQDIEFRTTQNQNLLLCNIPGQKIPLLFNRLKEILPDPGFFNPAAALKLVVCKGAATCNLGICNSPALARAISDELKQNHLKMENLKVFNLKISGCPNNCGQHVLGIIGLSGLTRKVSLRPVPLYKILLGGRTGENITRFSQEVGVVPARAIPSLLREYFYNVQDKVNNHPTVYEFLQKEGIAIMRELINKHSYIPDYDQNSDYYKDWGKTEDFSLAGIGPGECGAGVLDLIEADLTEADKNLALAKEPGARTNYLKDSLIYTARALQVVKGLEPKSDSEVIESFINEFVNKGIVDKRWLKIVEIYGKILNGLSDNEKTDILSSAEEFYLTVKTLYKQMDPNFRFPSEIKQEENKIQSTHLLDLKGIACPYNYVKAKLFLEPLDKGSIITIYLDDGEPIRNVPSSLKNDGHEILEMVKEENIYRLVVKKV